MNRNPIIQSIGILLFCLFVFQQTAAAQPKPPTLNHVEPPFWWTGMAETSLQLMIHGRGIAGTNPHCTYPGVSVRNVHRTDNPNYLFIDLDIAPDTEPGSFLITFHGAARVKKPLTYVYELRQRDPGSAQRPGISSRDIIYMLMPDRFANGDTANDNMPGMKETAGRNNPDGRHGGDIQGIVNHLDYFQNTIGVTALYINPLLENNMPAYSYHGYATTDFYQIDPRFGTNESYRQLSSLLKSRGMKLIKDMIFNHCGLHHWWMDDLPTSTWIHQFPEFTRSNYRAETLMDPYASEPDRTEMNTGWFDTSMPDLNQKDPFLARYLIQNSIWWIEYAGLNGIRMDTWPYADGEFMSSWIRAVMKEYPNFFLLGETWLQKESHTAWFQQNPATAHNPSAQLRYLTDFPLHYAMNRAFRDHDSWTTGVSDLYYVLSQDFLYSNPENLITFPDNHDVMRFFTQQENNFERWKMGMIFLFSTRGIPVIYYGTEILMDGDKGKGDGDLRRDFPGGWSEDQVSAFTGKGLTPQQQEALSLFRTLTRLKSEGVFEGALVHYIPRDGIYTYFRGDSVMVVLNNNARQVPFSTDRFLHRFTFPIQVTDLITGRELTIDHGFQLQPKSAQVFKIR